MRIRLSLSAVLVSGLLATTLAAGQSAVVRAAVACMDPPGVNIFAGMVTTSPTYGSSGYIVDRTISLCSAVSGASSGASAWVMLAGGGAHEYAQIGYGKLAGMAATQTFTEYNDGSTTPPNWARLFYAGIFSAGANHSYIVSYNFSSDRVGMSVDGSSKATTPWGAPFVWQTGWTGQFNGETLDRGDDIPGTQASPAEFSLITTKSCHGCSYVQPTVAASGSDLAVYKFAWVIGTDTRFRVWTQR
jgi:hypothetical protein